MFKFSDAAASAAVVLFSLSTGCATPVAGLKADPSFTYDSVLNDKIAIGGVGAYAGLDEQATAQYSSLLKTMIQEERGEYEIAPPGTLKSQLGDDVYASMMKTFSATGSLDQAGLDALTNYRAARYVAFCIIESDDVATDRQLAYQKDKQGRNIPSSEKIVKTAIRTVSANLAIYDARSQKRVWSGSVSKAITSNQEYSPERTNVLVDIVKAAQNAEEQTDDEKYPPPAAPSTDQVLAQVFKGFAENMPKN
jgi:hypothetical protein